MPIKKEGFTLIELIIVIVIIVIIAGVAMNSRVDITQIRSREIAKKIKSDIRYAQSYALSHQNRTRIDFNVSAGTYSLYIEGSAGNWSLASEPATKQNFTVNLSSDDYSGVEFNQVNFDGTDNGLVFDAVGTPYSYDPSDGSIALLSAEGNVSISSDLFVLVEPETGKVKVE